MDLTRAIICACVAATIGAASTAVRADGGSVGPGAKDHDQEVGTSGVSNQGIGAPGVSSQGIGAPGVSLDPLGVVRTLYLSAAYEDALAALAGLPAGVDDDQAEKLRALCLLALNRTDDAQRVLARLATRKPMLKLGEAESPKLVSMFRAARAQVLPAAIKALYSAAKSSFERGDLAMAVAQFSDVIQLISENELTRDAALSDIRLLAEGFSKLANQQLAAQNLTTSPAPSGAEPPTSEPATVTSAPESDSETSPARAATSRTEAAADAAVIYSADDGDVVAPGVIDQTVPKWTPPTVGDYRSQTFSGVVELIIDETGSVVSVSLVQRLNVMYDQLLVRAAKGWRYRPALRNGQPVKYRKQINIVLHPANQVTDQSGRPND